MQYHRPPQLEKDLHCIWLHHYNPYLRLGPFKYETKHQNPEIAVIHDLVNPKETEKIKNLTRGKMKSTPYTSSGKLNAYSKGRTSKVKYLNERSVPEAMVLSKRIEFKLSILCFVETHNVFKSLSPHKFFCPLHYFLSSSHQIRKTKDWHQIDYSVLDEN